MAGALSGIFAYGLMQMHGLGGLDGWCWIFIIEGIITCLLGIGCYVLIVDFPEEAASTWKFLNQKEIQFVIARIELDRHDVIPEPFAWGKYLRCALDLKYWAFAALYGLTTTTTYAIAYFLAVILREGMKFSLPAAQCLVTPPYVFSGIVMYVTSWYGDKYHVRGRIIVFNSILGLIGLPLLGFAHNNGVRYFGAFLATASGNSNVPAILTYHSNNVRGQWKRAFASATVVAFGGIGGIIGSTVFREQDAPNYRPGIMTTMIANGLIIVIVALLTIKFHRANKRADGGGKIIEGQYGFRYTL
jgi:hypothetical protein